MAQVSLLASWVRFSGLASSKGQRISETVAALLSLPFHGYFMELSSQDIKRKQKNTNKPPIYGE